jgi:hypothetical protein
MGVLAEAYNQVGEHGRAKQICEQALGLAHPDDAVYSGLQLLLEVALVIAHASLGEFAPAEQRIERQLARHAQGRNPLTLGTLHETAARVAFMRKDRKAFVRHLKEVERYFCPLGNAPLIARYRRLTALAGAEGEMEAKIAAMREVRAFETALSALSDRALAARHMFAWLMQKCEGFDGYLFARGPAGLELLASGGQSDPPAGAIELARHSLESLRREEVTTHFDVEAEAAHASERDGPRQRGLHVQLLSFVEGEQFFGEGALVLHGPPDAPPHIRYDLLLCAARHLRRLNSAQAITLPVEA